MSSYGQSAAEQAALEAAADLVSSVEYRERQGEKAMEDGAHDASYRETASPEAVAARDQDLAAAQREMSDASDGGDQLRFHAAKARWEKAFYRDVDGDELVPMPRLEDVSAVTEYPDDDDGTF